MTIHKYHYDGAPEGERQSTPLGVSPPGETMAGPLPIPSNGRPRKLDEPTKRLVVRLVGRGYSLAEAAGFVACDRKTIRRERKRDPLFHADLLRAQAIAGCESKDVIINAAKTSWRAAAWLMMHLERTRESEIQARRERRAKKQPEDSQMTINIREDPNWFKNESSESASGPHEPAVSPHSRRVVVNGVIINDLRNWDEPPIQDRGAGDSPS